MHHVFIYAGRERERESIGVGEGWSREGLAERNT